MLHFTDNNEFNREMYVILKILEEKGVVVESDHPYAYTMQHRDAFIDVSDWLKANGYTGKLNVRGYFEPNVGAVYCLYDEDRISYEEITKTLKEEAIKQSYF